MSDNEAPPAGGDKQSIESLKRQARRLLKQARAGDTTVIAMLREQLPQLAKQADADVQQNIKLADVQHAVARSIGRANWADVKHHFESLDPIHAKAERFLRMLYDRDVSRAVALLQESPAIAHYSIFTAAVVGDAETVREMLDEDARLVNAVSSTKTPALVYALFDDIKQALGVANNAQFDTVRVLLDAGADPNASFSIPDVSEEIPALYFPCNNGKVELARLLLEHGANPTDGESVYHAAQNDQRECLELLVEFGADLNRGPDKYGNTPLHFLATHTPHNRITPKVLRGMQWLLEHGADPNIPSYSGRKDNPQAGETPLLRAAAVGHDANVLRMLVEHGARVNVRRDDGKTAYQLAMRSGNSEAGAYLASVGADTTLDAIDRLLVACLGNDAAEARAIVSQNPGIMKQLGPVENDALASAIQQEQADKVRLMLSLGWPLTFEGEWGGTPLHWAAWNGQLEMVRLLLEFGAPVNQRDSRYGSSPIAWCAHGSSNSSHANDDTYPAIVNFLLDAGATRPESYNFWNEPPESMARPSVVRVLRERGFAV